MAINMLHKGNTANSEKKAEAFISGAALKPAAERPAPEMLLAAKSKAVVNLRFDAGLLARLDAAAKRRGVSRTAWIHTAVSKALCEESDAR